MKIIGLTGSIATGKSTVAKVFENNNIAHIDADKLARKLMEPFQSCHQEIRAYFGDTIIKKDLTIDRKYLGKIVFNDNMKLKLLTHIVKTYFDKEFALELVKLKRNKAHVVLFNSALLIEENSIGLCDDIIVTHCPLDIQLKRVMERGFSEQDSLLRINSQLPTSEKLKYASLTIDTSHSLESTNSQSQYIINLLKI